ncbi:unnamed protein product [Protopolystoma xenopodis]|uniref:Uncharacterized protein n=1 Tax=Protopolystoma xenopodis TaxID=117903 RepID=A0A3S5A354_9PLAT|nr:unnamed protein product [Protopolystoma xenopodis]
MTESKGSDRSATGSCPPAFSAPNLGLQGLESESAQARTEISPRITEEYEREEVDDQEGVSFFQQPPAAPGISTGLLHTDQAVTSLAWLIGEALSHGGGSDRLLPWRPLETPSPMRLWTDGDHLDDAMSEDEEEGTRKLNRVEADRSLTEGKAAHAFQAVWASLSMLCWAEPKFFNYTLPPICWLYE